MKDCKKRLDRLEDAAGAGGEHTLTIRYDNDWQQPPREPVARVVPGLQEDATIVVKYVERWPHGEPEGQAEEAGI